MQWSASISVFTTAATARPPQPILTIFRSGRGRPSWWFSCERGPGARTVSTSPFTDTCSGPTMLTYATFTFGVAGDGLDGGRKQRGPRMRGTASPGVAAWCYTALRSHTFPIGKGSKIRRRSACSICRPSAVVVHSAKVASPLQACLTRALHSATLILGSGIVLTPSFQPPKKPKWSACPSS